MSGLPVTRCCVSLSRGTRSGLHKYSRRPECSLLPRRLTITSFCCASDSGSNFTRRKCSLNRSLIKPAGREVMSMAWPCGARTSVTCRSIASRALPPSSMPSSSTSARRAISACRSMRYRSEPAPCTHWRKASTQFQLRSKMIRGGWRGKEQATDGASICGVAAHRMGCQQPRCKALNLAHLCQAGQGLFCCRDYFDWHALIEDVKPLTRERIHDRCVLAAQSRGMP
eukprot:scaffold82349_cov62-Phaeocystis_antarctica.AAC.3